MSFLPVSQALQHLGIDGLVESKPRVGTRVRVPTPGTFGALWAGEALETQAARLCAEHAGQSSRQELVKMGYHLDQLYASIAGGE